jgi:hypothetical protein
MPAKKKRTYKSNTAESIEAAGNFLNTAKDKMFIICIFLLVALSFIAYSTIQSDKNNVTELNKQTQLLQQIAERLKDKE